jgi:hypothetical protein
MKVRSDTYAKPVMIVQLSKSPREKPLVIKVNVIEKAAVMRLFYFR